MAKLSTFTDAFTTLGAAWSDWGGTNTSVDTGRLKILGTTASAYFGIDTVAYYDATSSAASVEMVYVGDQVTYPAWSVFFTLYSQTSGNYAQFEIREGNVNLIHSVSGVESWLDGWAYSLVTYKYLRFREAGGTLYWEGSADGTSWSTLYSEATPFVMTSMQATLSAGQGSTLAVAQYALYDNFNILPTVPAFVGWGVPV